MDNKYLLEYFFDIIRELVVEVAHFLLLAFTRITNRRRHILSVRRSESADDV